MIMETAQPYPFGSLKYGPKLMNSPPENISAEEFGGQLMEKSDCRNGIRRTDPQAEAKRSTQHQTTTEAKWPTQRQTTVEAKRPTQHQTTAEAKRPTQRQITVEAKWPNQHQMTTIMPLPMPAVTKTSLQRGMMAFSPRRPPCRSSCQR